MLLGDHRCRVVQAPGWEAPTKAHPLSQTYAQNLLRNGYWHGESFRSQLKGWLDLFASWQPDLILAEHAPSALLAARKLGLPRAATGTGFSLPPLTVPMPGLQPWFAVPESLRSDIEHEFIDCVNPVLRSLGASPLSASADIFEGVERFLCTLPELDHYSVRPEEAYWGPVTHTPEEDDVEWPSDNLDNVFIYMSADSRYFRQTVDWFKERKLSAVVYAPGLSLEERDSLQSETVTFAANPVNLRAAAENCRLMISHGGHNAGTLMLLAGVPLLMFSTQLEQTVWAYRIRGQGLGMMANIFNPQPDVACKIECALESSELEQQVNQFAGKYHSFDSQEMVGEVVTKCLTLVTSETVR